ncbi:hypothetical protein EJ08DRAFT_696621 [Tothia fuscella]|uniref:Uncharacterized protein n=1 Tax=Tothia fuscella TaxID=1048955 RepID=A0A9P4NTL7_9PEZI|nr:hypothetical protein EJ08DRAFT_696621 [Tothia fuscella]
MSLPLSIFKSFSMRDLFHRDARPQPGNRKSASLSGVDEEEGKGGRFMDIMGNMQPSQPGMVQAVRVNPHSYVIEEVRLKFEEFTLPSNDPIFNSAPSTLTTNMELPIVARPDPTTRKSCRRYSDINTNAEYLFRNCNVQSHDTIVNKKDWDHQFGKYELNDVIFGPIILARKDKKPLHVLHARAIMSFAENIMAPLFDEYQIARKFWRNLDTHFEQQWEVVIARFNIARQGKKEEFMRFWYDYKGSKIKGQPDMLVGESAEVERLQMLSWIVDRYELEPHPEWIHVPTPYDVGVTRVSYA